MEERLRRAQRPAAGAASRRSGLLEAQRHFYAAQTAQAQARRAPEGFLSQRFRQDTRRHLLRAERAFDLAGKPEARPGGYLPGRSGALLVSADLTLLLDPRRGGRMIELGDKVSSRSLIPEEDGTPRGALVDRLFPLETDLEAVLSDDAAEAGDFSRGRFGCRVTRSARSQEAVLCREGERGGFTKTVGIPSAGREIRVSQRLTAGPKPVRRMLFATEMNLALKDAHVNRTGEASGIRRFSVVDPEAALQVSWSFSRPARLWYSPTERGSGLSRVYCGARLIWTWPVDIASGWSWEVRWQMEIGAPDGFPAP